MIPMLRHNRDNIQNKKIVLFKREAKAKPKHEFIDDDSFRASAVGQITLSSTLDGRTYYYKVVKRKKEYKKDEYGKI